MAKIIIRTDKNGVNSIHRVKPKKRLPKIIQGVSLAMTR